MTIELLWIPNFIPKIRKIVGAFFEVSCDERTDEWTNEQMNERKNETDFIDPRFSTGDQ